MKYILTIIVFSTFIATCTAQISSVGLLIGGGYTAVDVQKVVEPNTLSDWNNYGLIFKGFAEYRLSENKFLGMEIGRNRLYYWEYQAPGYSWYDWRTEWTTNAVAYVSSRMGENFFIQAGAGIHFFYSGTVFGLLASAGTSFPVSKNIRIPVMIRVEPIFGSATPIALNLATGIKFNLMK